MYTHSIESWAQSNYIEKLDYQIGLRASDLSAVGTHQGVVDVIARSTRELVFDYCVIDGTVERVGGARWPRKSRDIVEFANLLLRLTVSYCNTGFAAGLVVTLKINLSE